jgi:adenylate cyclase
LVPRHVPANVAVAVLPLQNDAKSVAEKVQVGLAQNSNFRELRELTARMLRYYREQDWTQALGTIELCRKAAERFGIGALYDTYAERIAAFRRDPPPPDWNGVYEAESK